MKIIKDVNYGKFEQCKLDGYFPNESGFPIIVRFHGGGLAGGSKSAENCAEVAEKFVENGYGFISVEYRMYPDGAKYPDYLCDCAAAIAFVKQNEKQYGGNGKIIVTGQSAGAWISLMLCLNGKFLNEVGIDPLSIDAWIIDSAQTTAHFNVLKYEQDGDPQTERINEFAPLYYVGKEMKFSKILLLFYEKDIPCRPEQNRLFYQSVKNFQPNADIQYLQLPGTHCYGFTHKDENGEFWYVKEALSFLRKKGF